MKIVDTNSIYATVNGQIREFTITDEDFKRLCKNINCNLGFFQGKNCQLPLYSTMSETDKDRINSAMIVYVEDIISKEKNTTKRNNSTDIFSDNNNNSSRYDEYYKPQHTTFIDATNKSCYDSSMAILQRNKEDERLGGISEVILRQKREDDRLGSMTKILNSEENNKCDFSVLSLGYY